MSSLRTKLANTYLVTPESSNADFLETLVDYYATRKIGFVQWRNNQISDSEFVNIGQRLAVVCAKYKVRFIINNRFWLLRDVPTAGLHLGQSDLQGFDPGKFPSKIIGISASNFGEAQKALVYKPSYLGIGAIRPTLTKPDAQLFKASDLSLIQKLGLPLVAIGGLGIADVDFFLKRGFAYIAMCQGLLENYKKEVFVK